MWRGPVWSLRVGTGFTVAEERVVSTSGSVIDGRRVRVRGKWRRQQVGHILPVWRIVLIRHRKERLMAGRKRDPGAEVRDERTTVRWTKSELERLERAREALGIEYTTDFVRVLALRQLDLLESASAQLLTD